MNIKQWFNDELPCKLSNVSEGLLSSQAVNGVTDGLMQAFVAILQSFF